MRGEDLIQYFIKLTGLPEESARAEIRAILTLPLLILRFFLVDNSQAAFTTHQLVTWTDDFDTRTNFHERL